MSFFQKYLETHSAQGQEINPFFLLGIHKDFARNHSEAMPQIMTQMIKSLLKAYHPDKIRSQPIAEQKKFQDLSVKLNLSLEIIKDPVRFQLSKTAFMEESRDGHQLEALRVKTLECQQLQKNIQALQGELSQTQKELQNNKNSTLKGSFQENLLKLPTRADCENIYLANKLMLAKIDFAISDNENSVSLSEINKLISKYDNLEYIRFNTGAMIKTKGEDTLLSEGNLRLFVKYNSQSRLSADSQTLILNYLTQLEQKGCQQVSEFHFKLEYLDRKDQQIFKFRSEKSANSRNVIVLGAIPENTINILFEPGKKGIQSWKDWEQAGLLQRIQPTFIKPGDRLVYTQDLKPQALKRLHNGSLNDQTLKINLGGLLLSAQRG